MLLGSPLQGFDRDVGYRACGPQGEPAVVHLGQENDYHPTLLAPTSEAFVRVGLAVTVPSWGHRRALGQLPG